MIKQRQYKFSLVLIFALLFLSFEINAAKWTNADQKIDLDSFEKLPVPNSFPEYSFRAYESCETSKGSKFSNDLEIFLNEDFLWASKHDYHGDFVRIYVGKRSEAGKFIINVSEASKKWKNEPRWMQYVIPNSQSLLDALKSGAVSGKINQSSGYWRKCSFKINSVGDSNKISIAKFKPIKRQITSLNSVNSRQEIALEKMAKLGLSIGKIYDFTTLINELEAGMNAPRNLAKKNESVNGVVDKQIDGDLLVAVKKGFRTNALYRNCLQKNGISQEQINVMRNRPVAPESLRGFTQASKIQDCFQLISGEFKKLEEERKRAEAEAARKKAEEEETKRAEAEAARKKAEEEERKRAEAEAARKKAEEEERKRAEAEKLKLKIQAAKEEAQNLYSIFIEYVKTNSATDVLRLNELYVRAPEINLSWNKNNLDDFNEFKREVLDIDDFKEFYEERIEEFNEQLADAQLAAIKLLEKLSSELKEIIAENFGTEIAKETARLTVKIEEVITDFEANSEFDAVLVGQLIEDAKVLFVAAGRDLKSLEGFSLKGLTSNVGDFISDIIPNPLNLFK